MSKLIIIRGLPGQGKSSYAHTLFKSGIVDVILEIDHFWTQADGKYVYKHALRSTAHDWMRGRLHSLLNKGKNIVVGVVDVFESVNEILSYANIGSNEHLAVEIHEVVAQGSNIFYNSGIENKNIHGVKPERLAELAGKWVELNSAADNVGAFIKTNVIRKCIGYDNYIQTWVETEDPDFEDIKDVF